MIMPTVLASAGHMLMKAAMELPTTQMVKLVLIAAAMVDQLLAMGLMACKSSTSLLLVLL